MKFDMHCHTKEGSLDSKLPIEEFILLLKAKGFDGMLISDHDSYNGYKAYIKQGLDKKYPDFTVLQGIEYDTMDAGHILCILPDGVTLGILEIKFMPVKMLIEVVHHFGGILGPAHPYGIRYQSYISTIKRRTQLKYMKDFDFVERFNACETPESNAKASRLTDHFHKPGFGGSDAHRAVCAGLGYTVFPENVSISCQNDLIKFIKKDGSGITAGGKFYGKTFRQKLKARKIGFIYDNIIMSFYWAYNKGGSKINKFKHDDHLKNLFLREIRIKLGNSKLNKASDRIEE